MNSQIVQRWEELHSRPELRQKLPPEIADSWERSYQYGVLPTLSRPHMCNDGEMSAARRNAMLLFLLSVPVMENLIEYIAGTGFVIALFDNNTIVQKVAGDEAALKWAGQFGLVEGSRWSENTVGTNAAALGLNLAKPISLSGFEHFSKFMLELSFSFAPVIDYTIQKVLGGLALACPLNRYHKYTLAMVVSTTKHIEAKIALAKYSEIVVNSITDGLLTIDREGRILNINKSCFRIFKRKFQPFYNLTLYDLVDFNEENYHFIKVLTGNRSISDEPMVVTIGKEKVHLNVSITHCNVSDMNLVGNIIVIQEADRINRIIKNYIGRGAKMSFNDIIGNSRGLQQVVKNAKAAATSDSNVLLLGESGTGKDIIAQSMHNASSRMNNPFLAINCAALPRELIASELFGYEDGAFTGAKKGGSVGKFELADQGTLFLDEIGDMPLDLQASLLRVIEDKKIMRIGGSKLIPVNVRIVAATNKDLEAEVARNRFRRDLYYRLGVIRISIPPLRDRKDDIVPLAQHFLEKLRIRLNKPAMTLAPDVTAAFLNYSWPGNVRELQNVLEGAIQLATGSVITYDLVRDSLTPAETKNQKAVVPEGTINDMERQAIESSLLKYDYNKAKTARALGISRKTLYKRMKEYNLM
ncbi:MAG: sigma-54-dependent Fis family transcriptional regulator [Bacillota bacterium]